VHRYGGWVERIHSRRKKYVKIYFAADVKVVVMDVTTYDYMILRPDRPDIRCFNE
jgi:hypothetical protein